jgi:DtxR family Mn-dependent transcriptional regulator
MARLVCHVPHRISGLSPSEEEYMESIYRLERKHGGSVKVKELSKNLDVKEPSVVEMFKKLKGKGLVTYDRSGVRLTELGRKRGLRVVRRHKLAERLLSDVFKHGLSGLHEHACEFEHILDDELAERIDSMLGQPATCPHGHPIPTKEGKTVDIRGKPLTELGEGEDSKVLVIPEERGCVQRLLSLNILPGARVRVAEKLPRGAILLQCGKTQVALSREIASMILVETPRRHRRRYGH